LNYRAYRDARDTDIRREQNRVAQATFRAKHVVSKVIHVSQSKPEISPRQKQSTEEEETVQSTLTKQPLTHLSMTHAKPPEPDHTGVDGGGGDTPLPPNTPEPVFDPKAEIFGWEEFWKAYPRKVSKKSALRAFTKLGPDAGLLQTILRALEVHRRQDCWVKDGGQFIPHPATWLNGRRWEDEVGKAAGKVIGCEDVYDKYQDSQLR